MTPEQVAVAANNWIALQGVIGTHGFNEELENLVLVLRARGKVPEERIVAAVAEVRNRAIVATCTQQYVDELWKVMDKAQSDARMASDDLREAENRLRNLAAPPIVLEEDSDVVEVEPVADNDSNGYDESEYEATGRLNRRY